MMHCVVMFLALARAAKREPEPITKPQVLMRLRRVHDASRCHVSAAGSRGQAGDTTPTAIFIALFARPLLCGRGLAFNAMTYALLAVVVVFAYYGFGSPNTSWFPKGSDVGISDWVGGVLTA